MAKDSKSAIDNFVEKLEHGAEYQGFTREEIFRASFIPPPPPNLDFQPLSNESSSADSSECSLTNENEQRETIYCLVLLLKEEGDVHFANGDYDSALSNYRDIFNAVLSGRAQLSRNFYNEGYLEMLRADKKKAHRFPMFLTLVSCCNNIAKIYRSRRDFMSALEWLEEIEVLYECFKKIYPESHPTFLKIYRTLEYITYHMKAALQSVRIFSDLQNASSAAFFAYLCNKNYPRLYPTDIQEIREIKQKCDTVSYFSMRHPDPKHITDFDVKDSSLQVQGVWSKIRIAPPSDICPAKRHHRNTWIWRRKLYIAFGISAKDKSDCADDGDAWCIESGESARWRRLPEIPRIFRRMPAQSEQFIVFDNRAWFFAGRLEILRFSMISETWDVVKTTADFSFPYIFYRLYDSYIVPYGNKICAYGGSGDYTMLKMRIFMLLDLRTLKWENLLIDLTPEEMSRIPSPRLSSITWASSEEDRFFHLYGNVVDEEASTRKSWNMYELWSFSFIEKAWTRERLRGNFPCHRTSSIFAYHEKENKLIVFGGITEDFPSLSAYSSDGEIRDLQYSMLADTFVLDLETRTWRQVITRNFPAWRSAATLMLDDAGSIYLYGGLSYRDIQLGKPETRKELYCFTDFWRLEIDSSNNPLNEQLFLTPNIDFKAGRWRQCSACQSIGTGYLRCQGTCGGKYIYCSVACQKSSWEVHKHLHGCRKMSST